MPWPYRQNHSGKSLHRELAIALAKRFWAYESPWPDYSQITPELAERPIYSGLQIDYEVFLVELSAIVGTYESEWLPSFEDDGVHFCTDPTVNLSFPEYDAFILHCMARHFRPRNVIELGSGMSSRVLAHSLSMNGGAKLTCVDRFPSPQTRESLSKAGVQLVESDIVNLDLSLISELQVGDILFIDSSHVLKNFGDVEFEYMVILPMLEKGVVVHVHDIFLPFNYPQHWIVDWRCVLTEQQVLGAYLHQNHGAKVLAANYKNMLENTCVPQRLAGGSAGSFWFQIV